MSENNQILQLLQSKSSAKQEVFRTTLAAFKKLTNTLEKKASELSEVMKDKDKFVEVNFHKEGNFESHISFSGDRLIFHMHSNVFDLPNNHSIKKTSYIKEDVLRSFCGVIHVYNFLNDSFRYNRFNDVGFLVARIFINKENHFLVEGEKQLGFLYNDFINQELNDEYIESIVDQSMIFTLNFDLISPNFQEVSRVNVHQILDMNNSHKLRTSKSLGFKFSHENK